MLGRRPFYGEPEVSPDRSQASSLSAEELVVAYHERTKHHFHRVPEPSRVGRSFRDISSLNGEKQAQRNNTEDSRGDYDAIVHYRPQSSSASRFTAGALGWVISKSIECAAPRRSWSM